MYPDSHCLKRNTHLIGFPGGSDGEESACNMVRSGFNPWFGKIPWRSQWQPTPVFWRSLAAYSPCGRRVGHNWVTNSSLHVNLIRNNRNRLLFFFFNCRAWNNLKNLTCRKIRNLNIACKFRELSKMDTNSLYRRQQHKSFYLANLFPLVIVLPLILFISFIHGIHFQVSKAAKKSCSEHRKVKRWEGSD